uniref:FYVE-type domain-containing protein n=1 Tax=Macrostomum lignano TaxID=282301 RepID=A0A1I8GG58_9PLAT
MSSANLFRLSTSDLNVSRISTIEQCFGDSGIPLLRTGRVLIAEGVLLKVCRKRPKKRQFFLFNDLLVYGNIVISKKKYTKQQIIELDDVRAQLTQEEKGFQVISPKKSFTVYTNTSLEASKWVQYINKYAKDCTEHRDVAQAASAAEVAPVWIPDKAQQKCMLCSASFTVINRRHHCRRCGHLVCQSCSNRKWVLPAQSKKPQRICSSCYTSLLSGGSIGDSEADAAPVEAAAAPAVVAASTDGSSTSECDSD